MAHWYVQAWCMLALQLSKLVHSSRCAFQGTGLDVAEARGEVFLQNGRGHRSAENMSHYVQFPRGYLRVSIVLVSSSQRPFCTRPKHPVLFLRESQCSSGKAIMNVAMLAESKTRLPPKLFQPFTPRAVHYAEIQRRSQSSCSS